MKRQLILILFYIICAISKISAQGNPYQIITSDIDNFWLAFDHLALAQSRQDSINIFQREYIDKASPGLIEFFKVRPSASEAYIKAIGSFPKFWHSVRSRTELVKYAKADIEHIYAVYDKNLPDFNPPNVCFVIGTLTSGGTTTEDWVLIGTEVMTADSLVDTSEFTGWLREKLGKGNAKTKIAPIIAHETIHTQQVFPENASLLSRAIIEGGADFVPNLLLNLTINKEVHEYGLAHECELWQQFNLDIASKEAANSWFYTTVKGKPADLGYFIGARICGDFYTQMKDKKKALEIILKTEDHKSLLQKSAYDGGCSQY